MQCPECKFICSDLRDVCPNCFLDCRNFKKSIGLAVTFPEATYQELIERQKSKSSFATFGLFRGPAKKNEPPDEVAELFSLVELAVERQPMGDFELSIWPTSSEQREQEVAIAFELAIESIDNPEKFKQYRSEVFVSEEKSVFAEDLQKELKAITEEISKPILGLRGDSGRRPGATATGSLHGSKESMGPLYVNPSRLALLRVFFTDVIAIGLFSVLLASFVFALQDTSRIGTVIAGGLPHYLELVHFAGLLLAAFGLLTVLYPLFSLLGYGQTRGMKEAEVVLMRLNGDKPAPSALLVRALCMPLSIGTLSFVMPLFNRRAIHDLAAGTTLVSEKLSIAA